MATRRKSFRCACRRSRSASSSTPTTTCWRPSPSASRNRDKGRTMFNLRAIGTVHAPYTETRQIPKGCGARHEAEGVLELLREYEEGLQDIEGFSHLFV